MTISGFLRRRPEAGPERGYSLPDSRAVLHGLDTTLAQEQVGRMKNGTFGRPGLLCLGKAAALSEQASIPILISAVMGHSRLSIFFS